MSLILGTNAEYHSDKTHLSSSGLKLLLKSPEQYYAEYILGQRDNAEQDKFTEGSFVHTLILEPHKVTIDYAVFPGLRKQGNAWEEFKKANPDKTLLSISQVLRCEKLAKACSALPAAMHILKDTLSEHTMTGLIMDVPVKARADAISIDKAWIVDVKTTSMPSDIEFFKNTVVDYSYQLSAALYCTIAKQVYNKDFDFYWLVLSKADGECHIYKASPNRLAEGTTLYTQGLMLYKHCLKTGIWAQKTGKSLQEVENYEILSI